MASEPRYRSFIENKLAKVYTPAGVELWMRAGHKRLGNRRPVDLIAAGEAEAVMAVVQQLVDSAYA